MHQPTSISPWSEVNTVDIQIQKNEESLDKITENVNEIMKITLERGENLETIRKKSEHLGNKAQVFKVNSENIRRRKSNKNSKMIVIVIFVFLVLLIISFGFGFGFNKKNN